MIASLHACSNSTVVPQHYNSLLGLSTYYCVHCVEPCRLPLQVFDVTRKITYKNLPHWYEELRQNRPDIPCILVANKIDGKGVRMSAVFIFFLCFVFYLFFFGFLFVLFFFIFAALKHLLVILEKVDCLLLIIQKQN